MKKLLGLAVLGKSKMFAKKPMQTGKIFKYNYFKYLYWYCLSVARQPFDGFNVQRGGDRFMKLNRLFGFLA